MLGACKETFKGGNHLKAHQQTSTGAWFLGYGTTSLLGVSPNDVSVVSLQKKTSQSTMPSLARELMASLATTMAGTSFSKLRKSLVFEVRLNACFLSKFSRPHRGVVGIGTHAGNGSWISIPGHTYSYHTAYEVVSGLLQRKAPLSKTVLLANKLTFLSW